MLFFSALAGFVLAIFAPAIHKITKDYTGDYTGWLLALLPATIFGYFLSQLGAIAAGNVLTASYAWIPGLGINLSFYVDGLSVLMLLLISGIGALILIYAGGYLHGHPQLGRFYSYILMFMASMLGVVSADNILALFIFWELTSISSYLLIGFNHESETSRKSALQALLVTGGGGLALLAGFLLLGQIGGSYEFSVLQGKAIAVQSHDLYVPVLLLVLFGAFTKSAQTPFHFWLPGAMAAPTPVSAYLHSATMVKAGIFLLARLNPVLGNSPEWHYYVTLAGAATMVTGALLALPQTDLKRLLAYSTVSALGALVLLLGLSTELATKAAMVFLLVHSLYKGALFMVAGAIDHETGTRDVTALGGLIKVMPITAVAAALAALSMSGFPPLLGFIGKELLYEAKMQAPHAAFLITSAGLIANVANVTIAIIVGIAPFWDEKRITPKNPHEAPISLWLGPIALAASGLLFGLFPGILGNILISPAVSAVQAEHTVLKLKLWHGINPVFMLSVFTVVCGIGVYFGRHIVRYIGTQVRFLARVGPTKIYDGLLYVLVRVADWQTRLLQHGYQRFYIMTILLTSIGLIGYTMLRAGESQIYRPVGLSDIQFYEVVLGLVILATGLAGIRSRSRLGAVISLGVVGYGIALVYVLFGAPDLAITQILVETLTVILFVFVLYRLPRFTNFSTLSIRWRDALIALTVGGLVTALVLKAVNVQFNQPISDYFAQNSLTEAYGRNVVNVILVDFRALDTLGEITVLSIAAVGVYALLRLKSEDSSKKRESTKEGA